MSILEPGKNQVQRCGECVHKRPTSIDGHIACNFPDNNMRGQLNAVAHGWWIYPWSFDPVWAITECQNYSPVQPELL